MKKYLLLASLIATIGSSFAQTLSIPPSGDNQKSVVTQHIGGLANVTVQYNSPDVTGPSGEDRTGKIWGTLVPYGLTNLGFGNGNPGPWRAGANENTVITFSNNVLIEGKELKAGAYGLHLIAKESGPWIWIFSNNTSQWGSFFYDEKMMHYGWRFSQGLASIRNGSLTNLLTVSQLKQPSL
ncbi:MAG: DUF2911 domain-containing protein [Saprospiraceae bacterium]|nr:DUF2911 domain-containing protein [Saprospiraceae bacterium]